MFDIKVELYEETKKVNPGDKVKADIILYNFGTLRPVDVFLRCNIEDMELNIYDFFEETLAVDTQTSIKRELEISEDSLTGHYVYSCTLTYGNEIEVVSSDLITVVKEATTEEPSAVNPIYYLVGLTILIWLIVIIIYSIRKK
mgnify:CR=1 FL=1